MALEACRPAQNPVLGPVRVPTVLTKNGDRLLPREMSRKVIAAIPAHQEVRPLLTDEHFPVAGTLIKGVGVDEELPPEGQRAAVA